jgi:DNA polymerase III epsilon subunit-like protein
MSYITPYDTVYLHKLFGAKDFDKYPFHAWPIDFASVLFANGIDPDSLKSKNIDKFTKSIGIDVSKYQHHNALDDAKLLRDVYLKTF